ncbi:M23 family metallopeptidase [Peredibacter sp. HCB2-198]|uniref:M23 family metallopeptidase n=1 Tax=Peredibacter sp. HCB2-198 TaxID=3383025 RepID=UPI0038B61C74
MDKYYTVMVIPEKQKGVKTYRIPTVLFKSLAFTMVMLTLLIGVLGFNYWQILQQVYENKHLSIENRQLKEQIQLFQMKMNTLGDDLKRINTFEKKLRVITGLEEISGKGPLYKPASEESKESFTLDDLNSSLDLKFDGDIEDQPKFKELKSLYDKKIAATLGLERSYLLTKQWSDLARRSFALSNDYAKFDFKYHQVREVVSTIETNIHALDQYLLDKESFLNSTPTILPADGWITSYFGQRMSPWAGRLKMHEGLDVGAPYGTAVHAPADGIVTFSGEKAGFGKFVQIDHGYGIETIYAHNQSLNVRAGQKVKRGALLAGVGNTGHSTGPHLHYEVRVNGIAVDPLYFILD